MAIFENTDILPFHNKRVRHDRLEKFQNLGFNHSFYLSAREALFFAKLNSTSTQTKAEVCLISTFPSHSPMTVVSIEVKPKTSFRPDLEQDFKYFN